MKIKIYNTRFVIHCFNSIEDFNCLRNELLSKGYLYKKLVCFKKNKSSKTPYDVKIISGLSALKKPEEFLADKEKYLCLCISRETNKNTEKPTNINHPTYLGLLFALHGLVDINRLRINSNLATGYYELIEGIVCMTEDRAIIERFYSMGSDWYNLKDVIKSRLQSPDTKDYFPNPLYSFDRHRYSIYKLAQDIVKDKASLIMSDDYLYKYRWAGRSVPGFGNITPVCEDGDLYPVYKITGIQGNQSQANISLKFNFKVNYPSNGTTKSTYIKRNIMLVSDKSAFQDLIAIRVSDGFKKKLYQKNVPFVCLLNKNDIVIDLKSLPVYSRSDSDSTCFFIFYENVIKYNVYKKELELISGKINRTPEEIERNTEIYEANKYIISLNNDSRVSYSGKSKSIYKFVLDKSIPDFSKVTDFRKLEEECTDGMKSAYDKICSILYNYYTSKKTVKEFFGLRKKCSGSLIIKKLKFESVSGNSYSGILSLYLS